MLRKQHYMTRDERLQLEALRRAKVPVIQIAKQMGFSRQTIYNELKRGAYEREKDGFLVESYSADKAQQIHNYNQTAKGRPLKIGHDHAYAAYLEQRILNDRYSPAAALAAARKEGFTTSVCVSTLYSYIDKRVFLNLTNKALWLKSKQRNQAIRPERRVVHKKLPSIEKRPEHINERQEMGHWEMDLVVGKAKTTTALLTLTERVTRQELIFKLPNKRAETVRKVFDTLERKDPHFRERFKSITTDNGPEFMQYEDLRRSIRGGIRFDVYYCHSYSAWEKGSNENHNRMIRRFLPKGTDLTKVSKRKVAEIQDWMNSYPRKILDWMTPQEMMEAIIA